MLKQLAQRGYGVYISRDIKNLTGHGLEQPALVYYLSKGVGLDNLQKSLLNSTVL